jgi:hypothetical protein
MKMTSLVEDMRNSWIDERVDVAIRTRRELCWLRDQINDERTTTADFRVGEARTLVSQGSKLLKEASCAGYQLRTKHEINKILEVPLPARFVFYRQKQRKTEDAVRFMKSEHRRGLKEVVQLIDSILQSTDELFDEVGTDLEAYCALEGSIPNPPKVSDMYLRPRPHAMRLDESATPRLGLAAESTSTLQNLTNACPEGLSAAEFEAELQRRERLADKESSVVHSKNTSSFG